MAACSNPEFDGRTDTIYSLDTPSVTAKAYPGVNVVSWQPVAGANGYKVTVYEEGVFKGFLSFKTVPATDTDIVNGKKYTYYVEAVSVSDPAKWDREVYAKNSRGEASVTAIVPPAGTSALELPAYESGYDGNTKEVKDDKFVVTAKNVKISVDKGCVYANIPAKAYLDYTVDIYDTDLSHEIPGISSMKNIYGNNWLCDLNSNNVSLTTGFYVYSGGKYKVVVTVSAYNEFIYKYSEIEAGEIEIAKLNLSADTADVTAKYLSDGKTACIEFTPAKKDGDPAKKNGVNVPTSWYKVYRRVVGEYATTQISGAVKESVTTETEYNSNAGKNEIKTKYYVYDEIADTTKTYEYIVVVENDGKYGDAEKATLSIDTSWTLDVVNGKVTAKYLSGSKTAQISFEPAKKDGVYVSTSWYKVYRRIKGELETTEITGIKEAVSVDNNTSKKTYYVEDVISDDKKVYQYIVVVTDGIKYKASTPVDLDIKTSLEVSDTGTVTAEYLYNVNHFVADADNTVRISFKPAQKDGKPVSTDWYKVYRAESDNNLVQTEITSDTNKIMLDGKDPDNYVIYDKDKNIDPAKEYVYTVVVENDGNFNAKEGTLDSKEKPAFKIYKPSGEEKTAYNDIEWTFKIRTRSVFGENNFGFDPKDVKNVKEVTAYLLVTKDNQQDPKANEVIEKGEKLLPAPIRDSKDSTDEEYIYTVSNNNVSDGKAYVVITATCDGYENAISEVSDPYPVKKEATD